MSKKENVCAKTKGAEKVAKAIEGTTNVHTGNERNGLGCPAKSSAALKKFKDADALARAYGALEAEFTRRSQRIKELEKTVENLRSDLAKNEGSGAEKLRKNAEARRAAAKSFDKFIDELGKGHPHLEQTSDTTNMKDGEPTATAEGAARAEVVGTGSSFDGAASVEDAVSAGSADGLERAEGVDGVDGAKDAETAETAETSAWAEAESAEAQGDTVNDLLTADEKGAEEGEEHLQGKGERANGRGEKDSAAKTALEREKENSSVVVKNVEVSSEELYARVKHDEEVRLKIIGEYLASLGKNSPPLTVGGAGTLVAPPLKAKNIADAGCLALQYFKKPFDLD